MQELIQAIQSPVNFALTVLLACFLMYWLVVVFGVIGLDALDFDFDIDADVDADVDVDLDIGSAGSLGFLDVLRFFNVGEVPLMLLLSLFTLIMWVIGMLAHPWAGGGSVLVQILMLVPMGIAALFVTKFVSYPLKRVFARMKEDERAGQVELIGQRCRISSAAVDHVKGQAEFETAGAPLKLNVKTAEEGQTLSRGDEAVIVTDRDERGVYTVRGF